MDPLSGQRAERPAGGYDRSFGAEGTTRPDGKGRGQGFQKGDGGRDAAFLQNDFFHSFGYPMPADGPGTEAGHQSHRNGAEDRNGDDEDPQLIARRGCRREGKTAVKGNIRNEVDQIDEGLGDDTYHDGIAHNLNAEIKYPFVYRVSPFR